MIVGVGSARSGVDTARVAVGATFASVGTRAIGTSVAGACESGSVGGTVGVGPHAASPS